jgi:hypothetical protein
MEENSEFRTTKELTYFAYSNSRITVRRILKMGAGDTDIE